jgi:hypothetical protein
MLVLQVRRKAALAMGRALLRVRVTAATAATIGIRFLLVPLLLGLRLGMLLLAIVLLLLLSDRSAAIRRLWRWRWRSVLFVARRSHRTAHASATKIHAHVVRSTTTATATRVENRRAHGTRPVLRHRRQSLVH